MRAVEDSDVTTAIVGFARTLRAAGVDASPERVHAMVTATSHLDVCQSIDVYWAGRLTTCAGPDDVARYNRAFESYFTGQIAPPMRRVPPIEVVRPVAVPGTERSRPRESDEQPSPAATASETEILRHRDLAALSAGERDVVRRLIAAIDPVGEPRLSRRHERSRRGSARPAAHRAGDAASRRGTGAARAPSSPRSGRVGSCWSSTSAARCSPTPTPTSGSPMRRPGDDRAPRCSRSAPG